MKFSALTGMRGFCAVVVAISHLSITGWIAQSHFVRNSYLFVDFFFVLSGFVIAHAYLDRLSNRVTLTGFLVRRFGRLFPLHLSVLAVMVVAEFARYLASCFCVPMDSLPFTETTSLPTLASNLVLAQSLGFHRATSWNFPAWSISVEFYTYMAFAIVAVATVTLRTSRRVGLFAAIMLAAALVPILYSRTGMFVTADYGLYRCLFGFFAGSLTYLAYRRSLRPHKSVEPALLSDRASIAIAETICLVMVVVFVLSADIGKLSFAAPLVFCVAVFVLADDAGPVSAALSSPLMRYLGDHSYSIYMVHSFLALQIVQRGAGALQKLLHVRLLVPHVTELAETSQLIDLGHPLLGDVLTIVYLAAVIAIAHLTYARIELPWRNWFNGIADRFEARHSTSSPSPVLVAPQPQPAAGTVCDT